MTITQICILSKCYSTTNWTMYVSDLPSPSEGYGYARLQHIIVTCFSILLRLTFQHFLTTYKHVCDTE